MSAAGGAVAGGGQATPKLKIRVFKIVVLGDGGVGKSALTMQFVYHQFLETHDPTIEDSYQQQCRIDDESAHLDILDTAGQPEFAAMREQYMRTGEGFIICYSVTERRSFDEAAAYKRLIERVRGNREDVPIVLVGNKCDLEGERKVSAEEGQALASQWECPFYETSAALRHFVDDAFHGIIRRIREREQEAAGELGEGGRGWRKGSGGGKGGHGKRGGSGDTARFKDVGKFFQKIFR